MTDAFRKNDRQLSSSKIRLGCGCLVALGDVESRCTTQERGLARLEFDVVDTVKTTERGKKEKTEERRGEEVKR